MSYHHLKIVLATLLMFGVAVFVSAKVPENYYAGKAEEAIALERFDDALDYANQEISDY